MACSAGLASDIEQALDMSPIQMILCLQALSQEAEPEELTPQQFFGNLVGMADGQVEVVRAGG